MGLMSSKCRGQCSNLVPRCAHSFVFRGSLERSIIYVRSGDLATAKLAAFCVKATAPGSPFLLRRLTAMSACVRMKK